MLDRLREPRLRWGTGKAYPGGADAGFPSPNLHPGWPCRGKWAQGESLTTHPPCDSEMPMAQPCPGVTWAPPVSNLQLGESGQRIDVFGRAEPPRDSGQQTVTFLGQFFPTSSPAPPQGHAELKVTRQLPALLQAGPCAHSILSAGLSSLPPSPPPRLGLGKAEATVLSAAVPPAQTRMKQAEETISQEQGPERVQIPALARPSCVTRGQGLPVLCLFVNGEQPQNLTPSRPGRL